MQSLCREQQGAGAIIQLEELHLISFETSQLLKPGDDGVFDVAYALRFIA